MALNLIIQQTMLAEISYQYGLLSYLDFRPLTNTYTGGQNVGSIS